MLFYYLQEVCNNIARTTYHWANTNFNKAKVMRSDTYFHASIVVQNDNWKTLYLLNVVYSACTKVQFCIAGRNYPLIRIGMHVM